MRPTPKAFQEAEAERGGEIVMDDLEQVWPEIVPFEASADADAFPLDIFPGPVAEYCKELCRSLCVDGGMVGPLALSMLSTVFQRRFRIKPKGSDDDWSESLNLFVIVSAPPSAGKSPVFRAIRDPLISWERERREEEAPLIEAERAERRMQEQRRSECERRSAKGGKEAELDHQEALAIAEQLAAKPEPTETILFVGDVTEEALFEIMRRQGGAITVASDEGGMLMNLNGRYKGMPDLDIYLKGYSGGDVDSHRTGRGSAKLYDARLSIMLCCQPSVLEEFLGNKEFSQRGLTARFLYTQPRAKQEKTIRTKPIPAEVSNCYRTFIFGKMNGTGEGEISLQGDALEAFFTAVDDFERNEDDESEFKASWRGKYRGQLARIIGLLHCAWTEDPLTEPISVGVVLCAVQVMAYFAQQFDALTQTVGATQSERDARYLLDKLAGTTEITKRDLGRKAKRFKRTSEMDSPLQDLEERGYIRILRSQNGGRPSEIIRVNPALDRK